MAAKKLEEEMEKKQKEKEEKGLNIYLFIYLFCNNILFGLLVVCVLWCKNCAMECNSFNHVAPCD